MSRHEPPLFLWRLFDQLRRRRLPLGIEDYMVLRDAVRAGFGLASRDALRDLCVALWAKSAQEAEVVRALFERVELEEWRVGDADDELAATAGSAITSAENTARRRSSKATVEESALEPPRTSGIRHLPLPPEAAGPAAERKYVLLPQFPLSPREIVQTWRRLRRPVRYGAATELDVETTSHHWAMSGLPTSVVMVPPRRNTARLLLLIDRQGSMAPYHGYVKHVSDAIRESGQLERVDICYFHDIPARGTYRASTESITAGLSAEVDAALGAIEPDVDAHVYDDAELLNPRALRTVLHHAGATSAAVVVSDAGAARGHYDRLRLLRTISFAKALRLHAASLAWLNPLPVADWPQTTAAQIARHLPMFTLDRAGMDKAVNVLRGHPYLVERPL